MKPKTPYPETLSSIGINLKDLKAYAKQAGFKASDNKLVGLANEMFGNAVHEHITEEVLKEAKKKGKSK